jgi:hypothetical protein
MPRAANQATSGATSTSARQPAENCGVPATRTVVLWQAHAPVPVTAPPAWE